MTTTIELINDIEKTLLWDTTMSQDLKEKLVKLIASVDETIKESAYADQRISELQGDLEDAEGRAYTFEEELMDMKYERDDYRDKYEHVQEELDELVKKYDELKNKEG